jgi:PPK2 family polyphosphate:nucleotide phosphotransferase
MASRKKEMLKKARELAGPFRVVHGKKFRLKDVDPGNTWHFDSDDKKAARATLDATRQLLVGFQDKLYAQDCWAVLLIFQAMDAAGKDAAIKHVMSGVNPQGCDVSSFKAPSSEELDHDFLWRAIKRLPARGRIGIFNRSYYEEVLVVRVHKPLLDLQRLPSAVVGKNIFKDRYRDICNFEDYLSRNGVLIRKFFLHLSKAEQKRRFLERLNNPNKNWKFSIGDMHERELWDDYMEAYEDMIRHTSSKHAPWYVVPADHKWFTQAVVAAAIIEALDSLNLSYPKVDKTKRAELSLARKELAR